MSLANVKEMRLLQTFIENAFLEDLPFGWLGDRAEFDPAILDAIPLDFTTCGRMLAPLLMHLANAAGLSSPP
jgi:hypothetical protein